jgi:hypothetical protein
MQAGNHTRTGGFVVTADEGQPFWFLNTLTITKVSSGHSHGQLSILDHRVPPGFAPPAAPPPPQRRSAAHPGRPGVPRGFRTVHPLGWTSGKVK